MRTAYRVLAYAIAVEVAIQAMAVVWAVAGLGKWIMSGGVADASMMQSEATLRTFYENSPALMGIVEPTADGDILHLYDNPASCRFFGAEPGTLVNKLSLRDIGVDPQELQRRLTHYALSEATGPSQVVNRST